MKKPTVDDVLLIISGLAMFFYGPFVMTKSEAGSEVFGMLYSMKGYNVPVGIVMMVVGFLAVFTTVVKLKK